MTFSVRAPEPLAGTVGPHHELHPMSAVPGLTAGYPGGGAWAVVLVCVLLLLVYLLAATRLHERGDTWPWSRTLAMVGSSSATGAAVLLPYADPAGSFRLGVGQHLLTAMVAPAFLAMAAPVLLALRTLPARPRRRLLAVVHSRYLRVLTCAPVVLVLDLGGLYLYYLTPLFAWAHQHLTVHLLVHAHMIAAGYLLTTYLIGVDPLPHRAGIRVRLGLLLIVLAGHDVLAKVMYARVLPAVGSTEDVRSGALLLYHGGDLVEMVVAVVLLTQWYRATGRALDRRTRRRYRHGDRPLFPGGAIHRPDHRFPSS